MNTIFVIGMVSAILTTGAYVPQAIKTIRSKSTGDLSLTTFTMIFSGTIMWLIYGVAIQDVPIILANIISALLTGTILTMKIKSIFYKAS